jgi:MHS family proline/betaine transporter-like MFS transporter
VLDMQITVAAPAHQARTVIAGVIGNVLEWYDFALFGFLAPIISPLFFPAESRIASLLATYGVFALGFLMRPVGGILFGHIGDRMGRKKALEWSVLLMALPTTMLGLLPTYAQIGLLAPLLLTLIRMLQGISVGGEFIGSISFLGEHAPAQSRGFLGSWSAASGTFGNLLGSGTAALVVTFVPSTDLAAWGWRVPFICGFAVGVVGLWLRLGIAESPQFKKAVAQGEVARVPLLLALRRDGRAILTTAGLTLMLSIGFYLPWIWLPTWMSRIIPHHLPLSEALTINTLAMGVMLVLCPIFGALSDRLGRRVVILVGCAGLTVLAYPLFLLLSTGTELADLQGQLAIALFAAMVGGVAPAAYVELFPTETRYSGIALGYNGTQALLGGTTPFIATWLIEVTGNLLAPAFYFLAAALLSGVAALCMPERARQPLK